MNINNFLLNWTSNLLMNILFIYDSNQIKKTKFLIKKILTQVNYCMFHLLSVNEWKLEYNYCIVDKMLRVHDFYR